MNSSTDVTEETDAPRPFWIPDGVNFDSLPAELKIAITGIVDPAYNELVLSAASGLEQSQCQPGHTFRSLGNERRHFIVKRPVQSMTAVQDDLR